MAQEKVCFKCFDIIIFTQTLILQTQDSNKYIVFNSSMTFQTLLVYMIKEIDLKSYGVSESILIIKQSDEIKEYVTEHIYLSQNDKIKLQHTSISKCYLKILRFPQMKNNKKNVYK